MSKDDYFVMAYKLLRYLYGCLKGDQRPDWDKMTPNTKDFPIGEEYFSYLIEHLLEDEYIEGLHRVSAIGAKQVKFKEDRNGIRITPKGIAYLQENSTMRKIADMLGPAGEIGRTIVETVL